MSTLTHNLTPALRRMALPEEYATARPKRLRFPIFNTVGRIIYPARCVVCRIRNVGRRQVEVCLARGFEE